MIATSVAMKFVIIVLIFAQIVMKISVMVAIEITKRPVHK